eukprot:TRINITY_DN2262_c0_g1_i3.p1 TRINITY_DN2262_c0_g1~~TRINITY_DN2262_c0_g1_i3.p1  ORF type:complete len:543 (-),score=48.02 TRINITY_DN2262_c0_g1_i3:176-1750(-)
MAMSDLEKLEIGCFISLIFYVCCLARSAIPFVKDAWASRWTLVERWKRWRARTLQKSLLDEYVSREVERQLLQGFQKFINASAHCIAPLLCSVIMSIRNGSQMRLSEAQAWLLVVGCSCSIFGGIVPSSVNARTIHIWYAAFLVGLTFFVYSSNGISAEKVWHTSNVTLPIRVLLSLNYSNFPIIVALNSIYTAASTYAIAITLNSEDVLFVDDTIRLNAVVLYELLTLCATLYFSRTSAASLRREALCKAQTTCLQGEGTAMTHLLDVMCDVVAKLDSEKRIAEHSERLAAMFAMHPKSQMVGSRLQDWMPRAEDREQVDDLLLSMSRDTNSADPRLAHVTLRDKYGTNFRAELFLVHFRGLDRSSRFYVGIQESRDVPVAELRTTREHPNNNNNNNNNNTESDFQSDASSLEAVPSEPLLYPQFQRTKQDTKVLSLMMAIMTWNFIVPPRKCCAYHAAWDEVQRTVKPLMDGPCNANFKPDLSAQCSHCGVLDTWDNVRDSLQCSCCSSQRSMTRGALFSSL